MRMLQHFALTPFRAFTSIPEGQPGIALFENCSGSSGSGYLLDVEVPAYQVLSMSQDEFDMIMELPDGADRLRSTILQGGYDLLEIVNEAGSMIRAYCPHPCSAMIVERRPVGDIPSNPFPDEFEMMDARELEFS